MLWTFLKSLKGSQTPNKQHLALHSPNLLLSSPRPRTNDSQPQFTACPLLGTFQDQYKYQPPADLFCNSCHMAQGRAQVAANIGLHLPVNLRARSPNDQLLTTLEHLTQSPQPTTHSRCGVMRHQSPTEVLHGVSPCISPPPLWLTPVLKSKGLEINPSH